MTKGKRADAPRAKALKPSANPRPQERRALQDLSNFAKGTGLKDTSTLKERSQRKPLHNVTNTIQGTALKDRPVLKEKSTQKQRSALHSREANRVKILTDEEIKKCHEWAKDGVEGFHLTKSDSHKLDKDLQDKRVKKKVTTVISALHGWSETVIDSVMFPAKEDDKFCEESKVLELEPEILQDINWHPSNSGDKAKLAEDFFTDDEFDQYPFLDNTPVMFELRDEPEIPQLGVY
ncbi:hypothetical protein U9M48_022861 [Paspalum notatum var. saurae]|uniref:Uncharacterized protein n=1 Tax=Paspalum notatum var. saurae TaxID=547442 RepID=A0AAQ3TJ32_PASNO